MVVNIYIRCFIGQILVWGFFLLRSFFYAGFNSILSKASAEAFFSDGHTCTAAQLIYMYSVLCLVYMTVTTQACFCKGLLIFFCSEILVSDLKMYNLTSFCFAGTKIRIINLVFSVSLKKE